MKAAAHLGNAPKPQTMNSKPQTLNRKLLTQTLGILNPQPQTDPKLPKRCDDVFGPTQTHDLCFRFSWRGS